MTAAKRTREAAYDRNGYANVADKFVTCVQREGSFSITTEDCRNLLALISERDALREVLRGCYTNAVYLNSGFTAPVYRDMLATIAENCRAALAIVDGAK